MDKIIESIILGIVQGITEFIPVSSSAHLAFIPWLFNWTEISESFDLALHLGTIVALFIYFFKDGISLISSGFGLAIDKISKKESKAKSEHDGKLFWYIILATIPAGVLSLVLDKVSETIVGNDANREIICIAIASIIMGTLLYILDQKCSVQKKYDNLSMKDTLLIGISQALAAAFPGVSRSGVTISTSRALGYDREGSAKISFLLSIPIILAAVLVKFKDFDLTYPIPFFLGILFSAIFGLIFINILMKFLKKGDYKIFAIYRVVFGIVLIAISLFRMFS